MSRQRSRLATARLSSVARRVPITHAPTSSALAPRVLIARRIFSSIGVISPHAPFSGAHPSMPPSPSRPAHAGHPGETTSATHHHGIYPTHRHTTSITRRGTRRTEQRSKDEHGIAPSHDKQDEAGAMATERRRWDNGASKRIPMRQVIDNAC